MFSSFSLLFKKKSQILRTTVYPRIKPMKIRSTIILFSYFVLFISDDVFNGRIISRQKKKYSCD